MRGKGFQRYCSRKIKVCCCLFAQSCLTVCEHDCRLPWSLAHCCTSYCNSCRVPGFAPCLPHSLLGTSSPYLLEAEVQRPVTLPFLHSCHLVLVPQSCLPLCDPMNCSLPGSSVHGTLQVRILEWVAISLFRGSFQPRDRICVSCLAGGFFTTESPGKPPRLILRQQGTNNVRCYSRAVRVWSCSYWTSSVKGLCVASTGLDSRSRSAAGALGWMSRVWAM